jgi:hypothetical protein
MDLSDIGGALDTAADIFEVGGKFLSFVREVKSTLRGSQPGGSYPTAVQPGSGYPVAAAYQNAGPALAGEVRQVAAANGDPWVPETTGGIAGIDLTGVWCPSMNVYDQCVFRQSGVYLNVAAMMGGMMTFVGEGLFDPRTRALAFAGRYANGSPAQVRAQLLPNGAINGILAVPNPWGVPMTNPLFLQRIQ